MQNPNLYDDYYQSLTQHGISSEAAEAASRIFAHVDPVRERTPEEQEIITKVWTQLSPVIQQQADGAA